MDRREFLRTTGAAAAAGTVAGAAVTTDAMARPAAHAAAERRDTIAAPGLATGARELILATPWRDGVAGLSDRAHRLSRRLAAALGPSTRVRLEVFPHGGLEAVMTGEADLYIGTENHNLSFHPAFAFFAALPGAGTFNGDDLVAWLAIGGGQDLWDELAGAWNVKPLLAGHLGRWPGLWSRAPIVSRADLAGRPVAAEGLAREVLAGLGAVPVRIGADDLAAALASGEVAAAELGGPLTSVAVGLPQAARHITGFGILEGGIALSLGVRRSLWERLPADEQATIAAVAAAETQLQLAEARAHEKPLRAMLRDGLGITFAPLPPDLAIAIDRIAEAVVAHAGSGDDLARRINRSYHAFRNAAWGLEGDMEPAPFA